MISVVIPMYNEESVIEESVKRIKETLLKIGEGYEIIMVNDGSEDETACIARELCKGDKNIKLINFSRNFGHQTAITAGMEKSKGDAVIVIDADLQDPPYVMEEMVKCWKNGYDVVYGKRIKREKESLHKKITAKLYYRFLKKISGIDIPVDTGDFRLVDKKVCKVLNNMKENNRYVRGLVSFAGFSACSVEYIRQGRFAGSTKYSVKKMLRLASDGITSFSYVPLKLPYYISLLGICAAIVYSVLMFLGKVQGSVLGIIVLLMCALCFFCMGIMGEYIGRIYEESKKRPLYVVLDTVGFEEEEN